MVANYLAVLLVRLRGWALQDKSSHQLLSRYVAAVFEASMFVTMESVVEFLLLKLAATGDLGSEDGIHKRVLSIHDHWLTEEEAVHGTLSFGLLQSLPEYRFIWRKKTSS